MVRASGGGAGGNGDGRRHGRGGDCLGQEEETMRFEVIYGRNGRMARSRFRSRQIDAGREGGGLSGRSLLE